MGRSDKSKEGTGNKSDIESSISSKGEDEESDEDEEMDVNEREETPDLYRNSSPGMYAG